MIETAQCPYCGEIVEVPKKPTDVKAPLTHTLPGWNEICHFALGFDGRYLEWIAMLQEEADGRQRI